MGRPRGVAIVAEEPHLAHLGGGLARRLEDLAGRDVHLNDERELLADDRIGDHFLVRDGLADGVAEQSEIELEDPPLALELLRVQLADAPCAGSGGTRGMQQRMLGRREAQLCLQRRSQRVGDALRPRVAVLRDCRDMHALDRELAAARLVHARNLEQRHALVPELDVPPRGFDEARQQGRTQRRELDGDRLPQPQRARIRIVLDEGRGVDLCEPETGKREDDAAEDQQLGAFLELRRACEPDPVRRRCAADLLDLLGGEHGHRIGPALHGDECLRDRGMELCARIALDLGERGLVRQPGTVRPVGRHRVEAVSND